MRLGFVIPNTGPDCVDAVKTLPSAIEALGYDSLWVTDHVIGVRSFAKQGYGMRWMEALNCLSFIAASTTTVRIGTGVLVAPLRDAVYAAKSLTTIDQLSGGRLNVGIGTGWATAEFYALGRGHLHEARGRATNEALELMLRCWQGGEFDWEGEFSQFRHLTFDPTPVQQPHPPLWIGGPPTKPVIERTARFGDVWHPGALPIDQLAEASRRLNERAQREVKIAIRYIGSSGEEKGELVDKLGPYVEFGCDEAVIEFRCETTGETLQMAETALAAANELGIRR